MKFSLTRIERTINGIFSVLEAETGEQFHTIEHSYPIIPVGNSMISVQWTPKIPNGIYSCVRGHHQLHSGPIETFEITGVPEHSGLLFHCGNDENASEGCVLLGMHRVGNEVTESRVAFGQFMNLLNGLNEFTLEVC